MKTHFTRKNFIAIALTYFYLVLVLVSAFCLDASSRFLKANNPIAQIGEAFGFLRINGSFQFYLLLMCFLIYVLIFVCAFIYEMRLAKYYENKIFSKKYVLIYILTFVVCFGLAFAIGLCAQYPYQDNIILNNLNLLGQSLLIGLILFVIIASLIGAVIMLYVNFKNIDKPFRFFGKRPEEEEALNKAEQEEEKALSEQDNLAASFGDNGYGDANSHHPLNLANGSQNLDNQNPGEVLSKKEIVFPGLCSIDIIEEAHKEKTFDDSITLEELVYKFRNYLAKVEKLYFSLDTLRAFIAGMAASRLIILEGLSGTGKSSLARYFSEFIGEEAYFEPVQATWRDRTSILGFYNDFSKTYNETEFLKRLYSASFRSHDINMMVLDEVNISRVEYYFADFLSILEYPIDKWKLKIMQLPYDFDAPEHLQDGVLKISPTTWFIGTANKDDSTFTITDKVYDRAITISFEDRNEEFDVNEDVSSVNISYDYLIKLFNDAKENEAYKLTKEDNDKFKTLTKFTYDTFDLTFGNRILMQIENLVPVYVALGGKKEDALDFMFSRKVISKLDGRFEDYIKNGLLELKALIEKTYGENAFKLTIHEINRLLRKL